MASGWVPSAQRENLLALVARHGDSPNIVGNDSIKLCPDDLKFSGHLTNVSNRAP